MKFKGDRVWGLRPSRDVVGAYDSAGTGRIIGIGHSKLMVSFWFIFWANPGGPSSSRYKLFCRLQFRLIKALSFILFVPCLFRLKTTSDLHTSRSILNAEGSQWITSEADAQSIHYSNSKKRKPPPRRPGMVRNLVSIILQYTLMSQQWGRYAAKTYNSSSTCLRNALPSNWWLLMVCNM